MPCLGPPTSRVLHFLYRAFLEAVGAAIPPGVVPSEVRIAVVGAAAVSGAAAPGVAAPGVVFAVPASVVVVSAVVVSAAVVFAPVASVAASSVAHADEPRAAADIPPAFGVSVPVFVAVCAADSSGRHRFFAVPNIGSYSSSSNSVGAAG